MSVRAIKILAGSTRQRSPYLPQISTLTEPESTSMRRLDGMIAPAHTRNPSLRKFSARW